MDIHRLVLSLLAVWLVLIPLAVLVVLSILGDVSRLYEALGVWGIVVFLACPVIVGVGGFLLDDGRRW